MFLPKVPLGETSEIVHFVNFQLPKPIIQILTVLVAAVILLFSALAGQNSGKNSAQSLVVSANAAQLAVGLGNFYSDQERFPSAAEFQSNQNLMLNYFTNFPPAQLPGGQCGTSFVYQRPTPQSFKLEFCLPAAAKGYQAGWNQISQPN